MILWLIDNLIFHGGLFMNRKTVFLGSFFIAFLFLIMPTISAIEYNQVNNSIEEKISDEIHFFNKSNKKNLNLQIFSKYTDHLGNIESFDGMVKGFDKKNLQNLSISSFTSKYLNKSGPLPFIYQLIFNNETHPKDNISTLFSDDYTFWEVITAFFNWMGNEFSEDAILLIFLFSLYFFGIPLIITYFIFLLNNPEYIGEIINDVGRLFSFIKTIFSKICDFIQSIYNLFKPILDPIIAVIIFVLEKIFTDPNEI